MNFERLLSNFKKEIILNESGIKIPKGTKSAKIIYHDDMDGLSSAKIVRDQLVKQGMNPKNIVTKRVKDSYRAEDHKKLLTRSGDNQMIIVVDFNRFDEKDPEVKKLVDKIDFHTDHHEIEKAFSKGGGKVGDKGFKSDTEHLVTKHSDPNPDFVKGVSAVDSADFGEDFETNILKKIDPKSKEGSRLRRLAIITNSLISQLTRKPGNENLASALISQSKQSIPSFYNKARELANLNNLQKMAIDELKKDNPNMKMVDEIRNIVKKKVGQKAANDIAKNNPSSISHIRMPETLAKEDISDIERMTKQFEKGVKNKNSKYVEEPTKESAPKKPTMKEFDTKEEYQKAMEKYKKDLENYKEKYPNPPTKPRKPKEFKSQKQLDDYKEKMSQYKKDLEDYKIKRRREGETEYEEQKRKNKEYKEKDYLTQKGNVVVQSMPGRTQPGRYTNYFLKLPEKTEAQVREWATFIQMALSPKMSKELKDKVDLGEIMRETLQEVKKEFGNKYNNWAFDVIESESGGHKGITNVSGLGTLGLMPKKLREELKDLKESPEYQRYKQLPIKRRRELDQKSDYFKKITDRIEELEKQKTVKSRERKKIMEEIRNRMIEKFNKKVKEIKDKKDLKESILHSIKKAAY